SSLGASPAVYRVGESVELDVSVSADAHVFCFYQQGDGGVIKLFPNRFRPHSGVSAGETLSIPGNGSFQIKTDRVGQNEQILCMASYEDIDARMPTQLKDVDLQPLPVESLEQIHGYYRGAAMTVPLRDTFVIEVSN
nr:DUF4384 domain-containing protein [Gammaproteobacteria bacterium]